MITFRSLGNEPGVHVIWRTGNHNDITLIPNWVSAQHHTLISCNNCHLFQKPASRPAAGDVIGESHVTSKSSNATSSNATTNSVTTPSTKANKNSSVSPSNATVNGEPTSSRKANSSAVTPVHIDNINIPVDGHMEAHNQHAEVRY